jgi:hypothetical protein
MDYSTWLTKAAAAAAIGCSTKTVEQLAQEGKIQQASWRRPEGGPRLAVYHPDDVARVASARQPGLPAFVLPAVQTAHPSANGNGAGPGVPTALATLPAEEVWRGLLAAALRAVVGAETPPTSENSENSEKSPWMTATEIARAWQWPRRDVQALIDEGKLGETFRLGRGQRQRLVVRRSEVAAFVTSRRDLEADA